MIVIDTRVRGDNYITVLIIISVMYALMLIYSNLLLVMYMCEYDMSVIISAIYLYRKL